MAISKPTDMPKLPKRGYYKLGDGYKTLDTDSARKEIKKVQRLINWYLQFRNIEPIKANGKYSSSSETRQKTVQDLLKLEKNGKFGSSTLKKLKEAKEPAKKVNNSTVNKANTVVRKDPEDVFKTVINVKAKHKGGANTIAAIKSKKIANCSGTASAWLNYIGCLSGGIWHTVGVKDGSKKNTVSKAIGGNVKGLKNCKIVKVMKPWAKVPKWLKKKGNVGIQNSNAYVVKGENSFYNCNLTGKTYTNMGQIVKGIDSYCGKQLTLFMIVPDYNL